MTAADLARGIAHRLLGRIRVGSLLIEEGHRRRRFGAGAPTATISVHSPAFWTMLLRGSRGLAEAYELGVWDSPDVVDVIRLAALNATEIDRAREPFAPLLGPVYALRDARRTSTRERRREDISAHYDLGNRLFERMLDSTLSYSCAVFETDEMSLEEAQLAKLERICAKLELSSSDRVVEIGTGWGSFALHAATTRGCHVTTTTISQEQFGYVTERVRELGLSDRVEVVMRDYVDLTGRFDKLVSIEMIEAVGWRHFGRYFAKCSSLLTPEGVMLIQAITIDDRAYKVERAARSFINTRIFPGGCLPSLEVIAHSVARHTDLQIVDLEDITAHYVTTLRRWRENFEAAAPDLERFGYDERFRRIWRLYLAYCEAGFAERRICDVQMMFTKPAWRASRKPTPHKPDESQVIGGIVA